MRMALYHSCFFSLSDPLPRWLGKYVLQQIRLTIEQVRWSDLKRDIKKRAY